MGFINWCKLGFHSYEEINEKITIREMLVKKLCEMGFVVKKGADGYMWQHVELEIFISQQNIDNFMPYNPTTFVCLECEKITTKYDLDDIVRRFTSTMENSINAKLRIRKAKDIADAKKQLTTEPPSGKVISIQIQENDLQTDPKVDLDRIEERIEVWHTGCSDLPLHEFLGMTQEEYSKWLLTTIYPASKG